MICKNCPDGRRFAERSMYCIRYGIIIRDGHECTLEGGGQHDRAADHSDGERSETEIQESSGGAAGALQGILQGPGERTGLSGVEG